MKNDRTQYARYTAGLNDFRYCATLFVEHPSKPIAEITQALGLAPDTAHEQGDRRRRINGVETGRLYERAYWRKELRPEDGFSLDEFLDGLVSQLESRKTALQNLQQSGGAIDCFIGIFARRLCDTQFSWKLLARLSELRIDLRLDYYSDRDRGSSNVDAE